MGLPLMYKFDTISRNESSNSFLSHAPMTSLANLGDSTTRRIFIQCAGQKMGCNDPLRLQAPSLHLYFDFTPSSCPSQHFHLPSHALTTTIYPRLKMTAAANHCHQKTSSSVIALQDTASMDKRWPSGSLLHLHESTS